MNSSANPEVAGADEAPVSARRDFERKGSFLSVWGEKLALPVAWLGLIVAFSILSPDTFPSQGNLASILGTNSVLFVLALSALLPSMVGDIDLSLGYIGGLSSVVIAVLSTDHGWPIVLACLAGVVVGVICGAVNALLVVTFKTEPFIMTLGTGTLFGGVLYWVANSVTITGVSPNLSEWVYLKRVVGIPIPFYYCVVIMLIIWYVSSHTPLGVRSLFVGQSRDVARLSGINSDRIRWASFILAGVIASLAGILDVGRSGSAGPLSVWPTLLPAYAAVFLGATAIKPGRFNPIGTGIAVLFLATGVSGLQLLGAQDYAQQLFYGGALVLAVTLSRYLRRT